MATFSPTVLFLKADSNQQSARIRKLASHLRRLKYTNKLASLYIVYLFIGKFVLTYISMVTRTFRAVLYHPNMADHFSFAFESLGSEYLPTYDCPMSNRCLRSR